ncbi:hypothetical protein DITRI_Ditri12bG0055400 [Diplodiscus trichospermus]
MAEEQIDFGDEEYGGLRKTQYQGSGAIPALADVEIIGEDDEYDDLYNDVNVGEGGLSLPRGEAVGSQGLNIPGISVQGKYPNASGHYPEQEGQPAVNRPEIGSGSYSSGSTNSQNGSVMEVTRDTQVKNMSFQGLTSASQKVGADSFGVPQKIANDPSQSLNSGIVGPQGASQVSPNQMGMNANHPMMKMEIMFNLLHRMVQPCCLLESCIGGQPMQSLRAFISIWKGEGGFISIWKGEGD